MTHPTIDQSWYERPVDIEEKIAAGGIVVRRDDDHVLVALIREGDLPGYVLPKGRMEPDENLEATARREIEEEAGLSNLHYLGELGVRERLEYSKQHWKITHYFLFSSDQSAGTPTDPGMLYQVEWFPLDGLPAMFWPEQKALIEENRALIDAALI
jgi:ADP-ribose pyrophosphatase YjhB (NUDIX family)